MYVLKPLTLQSEIQMAMIPYPNKRKGPLLNGATKKQNRYKEKKTFEKKKTIYTNFQIQKPNNNTADNRIAVKSNLP